MCGCNLDAPILATARAAAQGSPTLSTTIQPPNLNLALYPPDRTDPIQFRRAQMASAAADDAPHQVSKAFQSPPVRAGHVREWSAIRASPRDASRLCTQSEIVPNIDTTYRSPLTEGITTASARTRPELRSRTSRATHDRGGSPRRAHQQKNWLTQWPSHVGRRLR